MTIDSLLIAVATILATKAVEKIGENIGDATWTTVPEKLQNAAQSLKKLLFGHKNKLPSLTNAIEGNELQRLDYGQAVLELKQAAQEPAIAKAVEAVEKAVNNDKSEAAEEIKKLADEIKSHPSVVNNFAKLAENLTVKEGGIAGQSITIGTVINNN
ncbi:hypothetical protein [Nostoc sp. CMAA1605]|uniref:hypothetical protein n=1 Tax=Nostoc sp. CMAA1605 TaxID=2055159 RepID=UPI001F1F2940|nr:hypothetical protein [Nostoc sp. CMAA1605]MCF4966769.1 hypothetical protein [Nostoc sp. CMAA1605]